MRVPPGASATIFGISLALMGAAADALEIGVNVHGGRSADWNVKVANELGQRGLVNVRMDLLARDKLAAFRDFAQRIKERGGKVEVALQPTFQWDDRCSSRLSDIEKQAYEESLAAVRATKDLVSDFEMLNEAQLRPEIKREVPWNSAGLLTTPYERKPCVASLVAALRGMSRAIADVRSESGLPLRAMLGVVGRDFGFLKFMEKQGVKFDVVGYHLYTRETQRSPFTDPWYGPGGLLAQLAAFRRPVHINEINCGEIYDLQYENEAGKKWTEACLRSLARNLSELRAQRTADIESIHIYELLDEPDKDAPENRFGLMYDIDRPKLHLALVAAFAGAKLSTREREQLSDRGLGFASDQSR